MANRFLIAAGGNWVDGDSNIWAPNSGGIPDGGGIGAAGAAKIDNNSGTLTISGGADCVCASFITTGYGDTATVTATGPSLGAMTLVAGTFVVNASCIVYCTTFTYTNGTFTNNGDIQASSNISGADAGTVNGTGSITQIASGTVGWATSIRIAPHMRLGWGTGVVTELAGDVKCEKFSHGAGTVTDLLNGKVLYVYANGDDFWNAGTGTVKAEAVLIYGETNNPTNTDRITATADTAVFIAPADGQTMTVNGGVDAGATKVVFMSMTLAPAVLPVIDLAAGGLVGGIVEIGHDAVADREVALDLGTGSHSIASMGAGNAADAENAIDFGTCNLTLSGTFDGEADANAIIVTNTGAVINGGVVQNVNNTSTPPILHFGAAGAGNSAVINPSRHQMNRRHGRVA